jgi:hypothetical protein
MNMSAQENSVTARFARLGAWMRGAALAGGESRLGAGAGCGN